MRNAGTVLVVAAHPDDEVLGCGGTIARLAGEGHAVYVAILGEGITSRYDEREGADQQSIRALHDRSRQVSKLLGVTELFTYDLPDNRFDTVPMLDVVKIVERLMERLKPEVIYTHHGGDLNVDHVTVHRAVLTASRPVGGCPVRTIYAFEVPSSTEWAFNRFDPVFRPNTFMDISATLEIKIDAMKLYESESRLFPHPRSPEALRAIALRWGSAVGLEAAEAFELIREIC
ncbi:MAG: PIG-L family deacetylase [Deltaproteobacteria bacterium]|nr:PIG-L family deacetylase [Deltaproteobacteria bacterium]